MLTNRRCLLAQERSHVTGEENCDEHAEEPMGGYNGGHVTKINQWVPATCTMGDSSSVITLYSESGKNGGNEVASDVANDWIAVNESYSKQW